MDENKAMEQFADNLWENYLKQKTAAMLSSGLSGFRAVITAKPGGGKLTVQRPFDYDGNGNPVSLTLPCAGSLTSASVGTQVLCVSFGSMSNAFVLCKADLSNL